MKEQVARFLVGSLVAVAGALPVTVPIMMGAAAVVIVGATTTGCNPDGTPTDAEIAACQRNPANCGKIGTGGGCGSCGDNDDIH